MYVIKRKYDMLFKLYKYQSKYLATKCIAYFLKAYSLAKVRYNLKIFITYKRFK